MNSFYPVIIFASVLTLISMILVKKLKVDFSETAFYFSKVVLLMGIFGYVLFVQPLKIFWGRVRFRDLEPLFTDFTDWYVPNGITGSDSFPSGHSAMGFVLISFFILFRNKNFNAKFAIYSFVLIWAIAVAASRVVIGAHFLSDVIVGSMGMVFVYLYFSKPERTKNI
jgi:membrane-associated phospholipid phosphatase